MNDKQKLSIADQARRDFVKRAGRLAVAAPAAVLLLNATAKQAGAVNGQYLPDLRGLSPT